MASAKWEKGPQRGEDVTSRLTSSRFLIYFDELAPYVLQPLSVPHSVEHQVYALFGSRSTISLHLVAVLVGDNQCVHGERRTSERGPNVRVAFEGIERDSLAEHIGSHR